MTTGRINQISIVLCEALCLGLKARLKLLSDAEPRRGKCA